MITMCYVISRGICFYEKYSVILAPRHLVTLKKTYDKIEYYRMN